MRSAPAREALPHRGRAPAGRGADAVQSSSMRRASWEALPGSAAQVTSAWSSSAVRRVS
ncbi:hypothetical protein OG904_21280 [Streptomyces sp. NBC_00096]